MRQILPQSEHASRWLFWLLVLIWLGILCSRGLTHEAAINVMKDVDSRIYIMMAEQIGKGHIWNVDVGGNEAMPFFPLYSILLVPFKWLLVKPNLQVLFLNLSIVIAFVSVVVKYGCNSTKLVLPFISYPILGLGLMAWSENLSLPLTLLWVLALKAQIRKTEKNSWSAQYLLMIVLASLVVTRLANVVFIPLTALVLFILQKPIKDIIRHLLPAVLMLMILLVANYLATGFYLGYDRLGYVHITPTEPSEVLLQLAKLAIWYIPPDQVTDKVAVYTLTGMVGGYAALRYKLPIWLMVFFGLIFITIGIVMLMPIILNLAFQFMLFGTICFFARFSKPDSPILLCALLYLCWLLYAERVTELDDLDTRLLSPILIMAWGAFIPLPNATSQQKCDQALAS